MSKSPPDPIFVLRGSEAPVSSICFMKSNPNIFASGTQTGDCHLWNLKVRSLDTRWKAHNSSVVWLKCLDPGFLWTSGRSEASVLWDLKGGCAKDILRFPINDYLGFSHSDVIKWDSGTLLVTPGPSQEHLTVWDCNQAVQISSLTVLQCSCYGSIMQCKWVIIGGKLYVLAAYESGRISLWDTFNQKIVSELKLTLSENPVSLEYDLINKSGLCGCASEKVFIFTVKADSIALELQKEYSVINPGIGCISSRPDGKLYATGGWDNRIRLFTWKTHKPLAVLSYHKRSIEAIQFSEGGTESLTEGYLLAASSSDCTISFWDIYN